MADKSILCEEGGRVIARKNRSLMGSVSLGLLLAFVFAVIPPAFVFAGPLEAVSIEHPEEDDELTVNASHEVIIPLTINPVTSYVGDGTLSIVVKFRRSNGVVMPEQGSAGVPDFVYGNLPTVAEVTYALPSGFGEHGVRFGAGYNETISGSTVSLVVYIDEIAGGGGGGGGGGGAIGGTTGTDTGWQSYDQASDTTTVYVDPAMTQNLYESAPATGVVLVEPPKTPSGTVPMNVDASLPHAVVNQGAAATVPSIINMGSIELIISPQTMADLAQELKDVAGSFGSIKIKTETSTVDETGKILDATGGDQTGLTTASQIITVTFVAVDQQGNEHTITVPKSSVTVKYNPEVVKDPAKVNLYIIGSLIYVGGKVDPVTGTVTADIANIKGTKVLALEYDKTFSDIAGHWAQSDIELMASKYVVMGMTNTEFAPDAAVTRAMFVTLLARSIGLAEATPANATFTDVASTAWYYGYVETAYKAGLALGDNGAGGRFRPEETVSREEMAAFLVRAMKTAGKTAKDVAAGDVGTLLARFTDAASVSDWARTEVSQAVNEGLIKGRPEGQYNPLGSGSRAEGATMMSRFMKQVGKI